MASWLVCGSPVAPSIRPKCSSKGMDYRLDRTNRLLAAGRPRLEGNLEEAWPEAHPSGSHDDRGTWLAPKDFSDH